MSAQILAVRKGQLASPPVALLKMNGPEAAIRILDTATETELRGYLRTALTKAPCRIRRRPRADIGRIELVAEEVLPPDADFLGRWAAKLTFNPRNEHNFIFSAARGEDARLATQPKNLELTSDLFELSGTFKSSVIACPCGAQYPFLTVRCPKCGGLDPFGALWEKQGGAIVQSVSEFIREQLASNSSLCGSLRAAQNAFGGAVAAKANPAVTPLETDDKATASRKLLTYYESVFRRGCLNEKIIGALQDAPGRECSRMVRVLRDTARAIRSRWIPGSSDGWNPSESFPTKCQAAIVDSSRPALRASGQTAKEMVKVAAQFGPFHAEFKQRLAKSEDTVGLVLKAAWTTFKAVKTMGVSLLFQGAVAAMKDQKFQERFERFSTAFDKAVESCTRTQKVIDESVRSHNALISRIAKGMFFHLMAVFAEDYAAADPGGQERMAGSVAKLAHCPPLKRQTFHRRGLDAQRKRKVLFASCIGGGVFALLGITALVVMLFK